VTITTDTPDISAANATGPATTDPLGQARTGAAEMPLSTAPPLRELWRRAGGHRRTMVFASSMSALNKLCDIMPELLIGAAVDVVVNEDRSFIGRIFGIEDRFTQLTVLAVITVIAWVA
jgi:ATP-binding cassette subfamily B protein